MILIPNILLVILLVVLLRLVPGVWEVSVILISKNLVAIFFVALSLLVFALLKETLLFSNFLIEICGLGVFTFGACCRILDFTIVFAWIANFFTFEVSLQEAVGLCECLPPIIWYWKNVYFIRNYSVLTRDSKWDSLFLSDLPEWTSFWFPFRWFWS